MTSADFVAAGGGVAITGARGEGYRLNQIDD
jgi:hypothetical protein